MTELLLINQYACTRILAINPIDTIILLFLPEMQSNLEQLDSLDHKNHKNTQTKKTRKRNKIITSLLSFILIIYNINNILFIIIIVKSFIHYILINQYACIGILAISSIDTVILLFLPEMQSNLEQLDSLDQKNHTPFQTATTNHHQKNHNTHTKKKNKKKIQDEIISLAWVVYKFGTAASIRRRELC